MRTRLLLTLSLVISFALAGAALAAPPPAPGQQTLKKQQIEGKVESVQGQRAVVRTQGGKPFRHLREQLARGS
jgi:hypothetical protein